MATGTVKLTEDVLAILSGATVRGNVVALEGQLDRALYLDVNKALECMGGKWDRRAKGHVFPDDPTDLLDAAILSGRVTDAKVAFGFFETPRDVAQRLVATARIERGNRVLEPSAGRGAIADVVWTNHGIRPTCVEVQPDNCAQLVAKGYAVLERDFLSLGPEIASPFARVVMNPPFARQQDVAHVRHAWDFVAPGGRLVAVMAAGVTFRTDRKTRELRELIAEFGFIEPLLPGAFRASGTDVNTIVAVLDKPGDPD